MLSKEQQPSTSTSPIPPMSQKEQTVMAPAPQSDKDHYATGFKLALILASMTLVFFLMMLDMSILATAIPYITDDFDSLLDVGWYGSAYQLASASLQPLTGKIFSRLNSKWSYVAFLFVFEVGSAICGSATSSPMLIIGRAVAGLGGSGLMNGALTILNSCVPPPKQPALLGILMAIGYLGLAFGPIFGGALTEYVSWRWCFYINLPVAGPVLLLFAFLHIPDNIAKPSWRGVLGRPLQEFDLLGFALFAPASVQLFLALQFGGNQYAWNSATIIGLFCGAGGTLVVWLAWDYRQGDQAMVPLSILRQTVVWSSCVTGLFFAGSFFITGYYLPIYFQDVRGASPLKSGVDVLPNILPQMLMTIIAGKLIELYGYYLPFMLICGILNAIASGLLSLLSPTTPTSQWIGYQILLGIGRGFGLSVPILALQNNSLSKAHIPIAMSILVFCQNFGGAVMVALSQTIFTNSLRDSMVAGDGLDGSPEAYSIALDRIFYLCAGVAVTSWFFSWGMGWTDVREKKGRDETGRTATASHEV
ncbi:hypothetical protein XANCAGTX0491_008372 [Xanthoria calcicola]